MTMLPPHVDPGHPDHDMADLISMAISIGAGMPIPSPMEMESILAVFKTTLGIEILRRWADGMEK